MIDVFLQIRESNKKKGVESRLVGVKALQGLLMSSPLTSVSSRRTCATMESKTAFLASGERNSSKVLKFLRYPAARMHPGGSLLH